ncbi:MAG TPA: hypothetical protein VHH73_12220 [Verrucomicrobiae bacterium]|nr:hypothetical protein [Verrucomicrobiae bacterium]
MNVWPVIVRELRAEARRPFNYWLRVGAAALAIVVLGLTLVLDRRVAADVGRSIFQHLNFSLFAAIWIFVPLLTADCVSQERREGTLGLLFLTPLTSLGIVLGKCLVHLVRAFSVLAVVTPVLTLPALVGGVDWRDGVLALSLDSAAVFLALTAGLLATSVSKDWVRALILAEVFAGIFSLCLPLAHQYGFVWLDLRYGLMAKWGGYGTEGIWRLFSNSQSSLLLLWGHCFALASGAGTSLLTGVDWRGIWSSYPLIFHSHWLVLGGLLAGAALLVFLSGMLLAAWNIRRSWREDAPSARKQRLARFFVEPRFLRGVFRGKMTRLLNRNPIGWLEQYTWSARITKWSWGLLMVVAEVMLIADPSLESLQPGQYGLGILLGLGICFSSAASFRRERETGAMELLLVTPLSVGQIIWGRVRGLWRQFFPALVLLLVVWIFMRVRLADFLGRYGRNLPDFAPAIILGSFFTVPFIGLCFSMFRINTLAAWLITACLGLLLPAMPCLLRVTVMTGRQEEPHVAMTWLLVQMMVAGVAFWSLHGRLRSRRFVLS